MSRNAQVARILRVLQILENHPKGVRAIEIFKQLNLEGYKCVRETVYRDLAALQDAYIPLRNEGSGETAIWRLDSSMQLNAFMTLSYPEILSLFATRELMKSTNGAYILESLQQMFHKIETALGPRAVEAIEELSQDFGFKNQPGWFQVVSQEMLNRLHHACAEGHAIKISYRSLNPNSSPEKSREVGPDGIFFANGGAYLVAREMPSLQRKTFALARISALEILSDHYASEDGFDLGEFFASSWGVLSSGEKELIRIHIQEPVASFVAERNWHSSQVISRISPNEISFEALVNLNDEVVRWALSLGPLATVIVPVSLKTRVTEMAKEITSKYDRKTA